MLNIEAETGLKNIINAHGFFHPAISKLCEAMGVASQGAMITQLFFCKIEQTLIFLSGEELHAHHRTG
jgi:hypothetical protein